MRKLVYWVRATLLYNRVSFSVPKRLEWEERERKGGEKVNAMRWKDRKEETILVRLTYLYLQEDLYMYEISFSFPTWCIPATPN